MQFVVYLSDRGRYLRNRSYYGFRFEMGSREVRSTLNVIYPSMYELLTLRLHHQRTIEDPGNETDRPLGELLSQT
jgi:hypothetical protein